MLLQTIPRSRLSITCISLIIWISLKVFFPGKIMFSLKSSSPHIFWWDVLGKYSPVFSLVANMVVPLYSMTKEIVSSDLAAVLYAGYNLHSQYLIFLQKCISRVPKCCLSRLSLFPPVPLMSINLSHHQPPPNPNLSQAPHKPLPILTYPIIHTPYCKPPPLHICLESISYVAI